MAQSKFTFFLLLLLALLFLVFSQSIEGRQLKSEPKTHANRKVLGKETTNAGDGTSTYNCDLPVADEAATDNNNDVSPPTTTTAGIVESLSSPPRNVDNFRPTTPGHSPGAGHSLHNWELTHSMHP